MDHKLYDCEICGALHPWAWDGDCRDDANRYGDEDDYRERNNLPESADIEVASMTERVAADTGDGNPMTAETAAERLEYLRGEIRGERISYGELAELQSLAEFISADDVELLEWAGVPEFPE